MPELSLRRYDPHARPYSARVTERQWSEVEPIIQALHQQGVPRSEIHRVLRDQHGFRVSIHQLNARCMARGLTVYKAYDKPLSDHDVDPPTLVSTTTVGRDTPFADDSPAPQVVAVSVPSTHVQNWPSTPAAGTNATAADESGTESLGVEQGPVMLGDTSRSLEPVIDVRPIGLTAETGDNEPTLMTHRNRSTGSVASNDFASFVRFSTSVLRRIASGSKPSSMRTPSLRSNESWSLSNVLGLKSRSSLHVDQNSLVSTSEERGGSSGNSIVNGNSVAASMKAKDVIRIAYADAQRAIDSYSTSEQYRLFSQEHWGMTTKIRNIMGDLEDLFEVYQLFDDVAMVQSRRGLHRSTTYRFDACPQILKLSDDLKLIIRNSKFMHSNTFVDKTFYQAQRFEEIVDAHLADLRKFWQHEQRALLGALRTDLQRLDNEQEHLERLARDIDDHMLTKKSGKRLQPVLQALRRELASLPG